MAVRRRGGDDGSGGRSGARRGRVGQNRMPWKERNGKSYYYRSVRKDGRVVSEYKGSGENAQDYAAISSTKVHAYGLTPLSVPTN